MRAAHCSGNVRRSQTNTRHGGDGECTRRGTMRRHRVGTTQPHHRRHLAAAELERRSVRRGAAGRLGRLVNHAPQESDTCAARQHRHCGRSATPKTATASPMSGKPARRAAPEYEVVESPSLRAADAKAWLDKDRRPECGACAVATSSSPIASCAGRGRAFGTPGTTDACSTSEPPRRASAHRRQPRRGPRGATRGGFTT